MLHHVAGELLIVIIIILAVAVVTVSLYVFHSRRRKTNYLGDPDTDLRYFIQKQVDFNDHVVGYECLLRQRNADGSWTLPIQMEQLPLQRIVVLLKQTFQTLPAQEIKLAINLSYSQIVSADFMYFVRWAVSTITPMDLVVEYDAIHRSEFSINRKRLLRRVHQARKLGMIFLLDNFSLTDAEVTRIAWLLPEVDIVKVSAGEFRQAETQAWSQLNLKTWADVSTKYNLQIMMTEVENKADQHLADQLGVGLRQGYHFGHLTNTGGQ